MAVYVSSVRDSAKRNLARGDAMSASDVRYAHMDRYLTRAASLLHECAGSLSSTELAHHAEGKWSAAETIEHLSRT
jgi:hypothetical protein